MPRPTMIEFKLDLDDVEFMIKGLKLVCQHTGDELECAKISSLLLLLEKKVHRAYKLCGYHKCPTCGEYHKPVAKKEPGQKDPGSVDD